MALADIDVNYVIAELFVGYLTGTPVFGHSLVLHVDTGILAGGLIAGGEMVEHTFELSGRYEYLVLLKSSFPDTIESKTAIQ